MVVKLFTYSFFVFYVSFLLLPFPLWFYSVMYLLLRCVFIDVYFCNFCAFYIFLFFFVFFIYIAMFLCMNTYILFISLNMFSSHLSFAVFSLNYSLHHLILSYFQFNKFISLESLFFLVSQSSFILYFLPTMPLYFSLSLFFFFTII